MYYSPEDAYSGKAALPELDPNAKYTIEDNDVARITWLESYTPIAADVITAKINELKNRYNNQDYQRKRVEEYPAMAEQLDEIYHNGIESWKAKVKAVKDKYPKP